MHATHCGLARKHGNMSQAEQSKTNGSTAPDDGGTSSGPLSRNGWDGKLRVTKQATLDNPEALEDPDYSDEDAPPRDEIAADESEKP